jgi:hypothetical protein
LYSSGSGAWLNGWERKPTMSDLFLDYDATEVQDGELPYTLSLDLVVHDHDVIRALSEYPSGDERNQYALEALKIGVLALRHVGGQMSADLIQRESARLVGDMQRTLDQNIQLLHGRLGEALKDYFDPDSGRFNDRVKRLVGQDGELSQLIKGFIDGENSQLARTMFAQIGPLMKHLDPQQSEGLLAVLRTSVEAQLTLHRDHVLKEFSLDHKDSALCRLVNELTAKHGDLSKGLQEKIDVVIKEFSLNEEGSSLSRLVQNVSQAQRTITNEFSLDSDTSCLSRLKRELVELLATAERKNQQFQEEVKVSLAKIVTTRREAERSTRHGVEFETAVCEYLAREAQHAGDIVIPTAHTTGLIKNCKVGDCVVELGPDSAAPGAKIVVEAKEDVGYSLARAREEMETARKNRAAEWGLFVFSKKTAPPGLETFQRYGNEFVVVWDIEDPMTDVFLKAGILGARAMCVRDERQSASQQVDFEAIDKAICEIEKRAGNLDDVRKSAETIQTASGKILERVRIDREALEKQVGVLRERVADLKTTVAAPQ